MTSLCRCNSSYSVSYYWYAYHGNHRITYLNNLLIHTSHMYTKNQWTLKTVISVVIELREYLKVTSSPLLYSHAHHHRHWLTYSTAPYHPSSRTKQLYISRKTTNQRASTCNTYSTDIVRSLVHRILSLHQHILLLLSQQPHRMYNFYWNYITSHITLLQQHSLSTYIDIISMIC